MNFGGHGIPNSEMQRIKLESDCLVQSQIGS